MGNGKGGRGRGFPLGSCRKGGGKGSMGGQNGGGCSWEGLIGPLGDSEGRLAPPESVVRDGEEEEEEDEEDEEL